MRVAIIGGGISGLSCAYRLSVDQGRRCEVILLESGRFGGLLQTLDTGRYLIEAGPDSVVTHKPEALQLIRELGLQEDVLESRLEHRGAQLFVDGTLHTFPVGLLMRDSIDKQVLLRSPLLGPQSRQSVEQEPQQPRGRSDDESVADFFSRRLGPDFLRTLVDPVVGGVYGSRSDRISMRSAFPRLFQTERRVGTILSAADRGSSTRRDMSPFASLRGGMGSFAQGLIQSLRSSCELVSGAAVTQLRSSEGRWKLKWKTGETDADHVVLALPAPSAADLMAGIDSDCAQLLRTITYSRSIVGCFGFAEDVTSELSGTGFLVPAASGLDVMAGTAVHHKFTNRCPSGESLVRLFVGAERAPALWQESNEEIARRMLKDLSEVLGIQVPFPVEKQVFRWRCGLPEYRVGHHKTIAHLSHRVGELEGLHLVGNFIDGVGISDCIRHANRVVSQLSASY